MQIFKYKGKNINKECDISMNKTIYDPSRVTIKIREHTSYSFIVAQYFKS